MSVFERLKDDGERGRVTLGRQGVSTAHHARGEGGCGNEQEGQEARRKRAREGGREGRPYLGEVGGVGQVSIMKKEAYTRSVSVLVQMLDAVRVERGRAADDLREGGGLNQTSEKRVEAIQVLRPLHLPRGRCSPFPKGTHTGRSRPGLSHPSKGRPYDAHHSRSARSECMYEEAWW